MPQALDKQLYSAIELLNDKQKKAVLGIVKAIPEGEAQEYGEHWQDKAFVTEMESRYAYYKSGGKMITADEANKQIKELLQKAGGK